MSADDLRRAASLMRARAEAASDDGWPWVARAHHSRRNATTVQTRGQTYLAHYVKEADAEHIASWHPAVALAVADWLDEAADHLDVDLSDESLDICPTAREGLGCSVVEHALAVARAYLGADA